LQGNLQENPQEIPEKAQQLGEKQEKKLKN